jgi:putative transposase
VSDTLSVIANHCGGHAAEFCVRRTPYHVFYSTNAYAPNFAGAGKTMPRRRRIFTAGISVHVIQRGNNRAAIFGASNDCEHFLELLRRSARNFSVAVHAFVLMTNHYHLIVTPASDSGLPRMMKALDGGYVRYFNKREERIGTLWNGRYRGLPIEDERYWLTCLRYVEQNPVRAGMVQTPSDYHWSSYCAHAFGRWPMWLTPHAVYQSLGRDDSERQRAYRELCGRSVKSDDPLLIL